MANEWDRYGMTQEDWENLSEEDREKLTGQEWVTKHCDICGKAVAVLSTHEGPTWCLEHAGTWKEPQ